MALHLVRLVRGARASGSILRIRCRRREFSILLSVVLLTGYMDIARGQVISLPPSSLFPLDISHSSSSPGVDGRRLITLHNPASRPRTFWLEAGTPSRPANGVSIRDERSDDAGPLLMLRRLRTPVFEVPVAANTRIHLEIPASFPVDGPLWLWVPEAYTRHVALSNTLFGLFFGTLAALALYNLFVFVSVRDPAHLWYGAVHLLLPGHVAATEGFLGEEFGGVVTGTMVLGAVLWQLAVAAMGAFSRSLLNTAVLAPRIDKALVGCAVLAALSAFVAPLVGAGVRDALGWITPAVLGLSVVPASVQVLRVGYRPARLFLAAWFVLWAVGALRVASALGLRSTGHTDEYGFFAGAVVGALGFAFALADKLNYYRREKERAQARVLAVQTLARETLEQQVGDRTRHLDAALQQAQAANRAKTEFISTMSHEVRTPLAVLLGTTELLLQRPDPEEQQHLLQRQQVCGQMLGGLMDEVLELSRIEAGALQLQSRRFDLHQLLDAVLSVWRLPAQRKGLAVHGDYARVPQFVHGDPQRLQQVLGNLLDNAVKFTERGTVGLSVDRIDGSEDGPALYFEVIDSGAGFDAEQAERLFEPFTRLDASLSRAHGGAGLGLAISRRLVEGMGGTLGADSRPGGGAQFWFVLPLADASQSGDESDTVVATGPACERRFQILLVDDAEDGRDVMARLLERRGHRVTAVASGEQALEAARGHCFDVVLMDLQMPVMDGYEATRRLHRQGAEQGRPLRVIALTANAMPATESLCRAAGMDGLLAKPLSIDALERHLRVVCGPEPTAESAPPSLDVLRAQMGEAEFVRALQIFRDATAGRREQMDKAYRRERPEQLAKLAHTVAGSAATFGFTGLYRLARELEDGLVAQPLMAHHEATYAALNAALDACLQCLDEELERQPAQVVPSA